VVDWLLKCESNDYVPIGDAFTSPNQPTTNVFLWFHTAFIFSAKDVFFFEKQHSMFDVVQNVLSFQESVLHRSGTHSTTQLGFCL
jgi:hypothetical protein